MAKKKQKTFTDQIRDALRQCGISRYRISREAEVSEGQMCRFLAGAGLSMESLDKLAEYLGLEVTITKREAK